MHFTLTASLQRIPQSDISPIGLLAGDISKQRFRTVAAQSTKLLPWKRCPFHHCVSRTTSIIEVEGAISARNLRGSSLWCLLSHRTGKYVFFHPVQSHCQSTCLHTSTMSLVYISKRSVLVLSIGAERNFLRVVECTSRMNWGECSMIACDFRQGYRSV
jgi:hypothetical protein